MERKDFFMGNKNSHPALKTTESFDEHIKGVAEFYTKAFEHIRQLPSFHTGYEYSTKRLEALGAKHGFPDAGNVLELCSGIGSGMIYLAKKYPFITIYSYEPIPDSYKHLLMSIKANKVYNIKPFNKSITGDGRNVTMVVNLNDTGGGSFNAPEAGKIKCGHTFYPKIKSIFLDKVFIENKIKKCKFLKIDCEGAEYEILLNSKMLNRIEYFSGEFHYNKYITSQGYSPEKLYNHLIKYIKKDNIKYHTCKMAE